MPSPLATYGLECNDGVLRIAVAARHGTHWRVHLLTESPLASFAFDEHGITDPKAAGTQLRASLAHAGRLPAFAAFALPDSFCYVFTLTMPELADRADLNEAVRWEAAQHLPLAADETVLDWQRLGEHDGKVTFQIAAVAKHVSESVAQTFEHAGVRLARLVPSAFGMYHAVQPPNGQTAIYLRIDQTTSTLALVTPDGMPFLLTTEQFSDARTAKTLTTKLRLSLDEAQKAKWVWGVDPGVADTTVRDALATDMKNLSNTILQIQSYANDQLGGLRCTYLAFTGSGAPMRGLANDLAARTHLSVLPAPLRNDVLLDRRVRKTIPPERLASFTTVLGLPLGERP